MKPKTPTPELNRQILDEASEWFVDFRVGDVDSGARERFDEWLRRSPEHIRAYWEIARTYVDLPPASAFGKLDPDEFIAYVHSDANVVRLHAITNDAHALRVESACEVLNEGTAERAPRRFRHPFFAAAAVAFAFVLGAAVWWQAHRYPLYTTDIGERRSITLLDGSTVDLNARSQLRVEFSDRERRVELLTGQALFQVAKDKARPFTVRSGEATVRAVGTQFDVNRKDSGTTVTVLEGRVAVYSSVHRQEDSGAAEPESSSMSKRKLGFSPTDRAEATSASDNARRVVASNSRSPPGLEDPSGSAAVFVDAGEQVTVTPTAIVSPRHTDPATAAAWLQRKLIFEGTKLSDVVSEFNRYNRVQLVIEDPKLRDFELSGVYSSTDPASLLRFLRDQGVKIAEGDNKVRLQAK